MNTLIIKKNPDKLTQSHIKFNDVYFDHVKWDIRENTLTFEGYEIQTGIALCFPMMDDVLRHGLDKIEDRFIKIYTEKYGFLYLKKRKFRGVTGKYVFKIRHYKKITTNVWTVIGENHEQRSTNQE